MGLNQSTGGVCAVPADYTLNAEGGKAISQAEIQRYVSSIRRTVQDSLESFSQRYERYMRAFEPDAGVLKRCTHEFVNELTHALCLHRDSPNGYVDLDKTCFKVLDAFIPRPPSGSETGIYYALDFGGSNFRVIRCAMSSGKIEVKALKASLMDAKCELPKGLLDPKATASQMFDFFAQQCRDFMEENGDIKHSKHFDCGFTFSYPCANRGLSQGELITWTKGFETGRDTQDPVEGNDVGGLMNEAFRRFKLPLKVTCIANDTVGTLLSCAYDLKPEDPPCIMGVILGTGVNAAYVEKKASEFNYQGNIINLECGNYNKALPRTNIDYEIDFADVGGRGKQQLEKMVAGAYLGETVRRTCVKIFQYKATPSMWRVGSFGSDDASVCIGDKSPNLVAVEKKCRELWNIDLKPEELKWVQNICEVVFRRSAAVAAVMISGIALRTGRLQEALGGLTVGIDGSLWKLNPRYRQDLKFYLSVILGENQAKLINCRNAEDGSGLGAAILAAVADDAKAV